MPCKRQHSFPLVVTVLTDRLCQSIGLGLRIGPFSSNARPALRGPLMCRRHVGILFPVLGVKSLLWRSIMRRNAMSGRKAKRVFRGSAGVHPRNYAPMPMRGGIRA